MASRITVEEIRRLQDALPRDNHDNAFRFTLGEFNLDPRVLTIVRRTHSVSILMVETIDNFVRRWYNTNKNIEFPAVFERYTLDNSIVERYDWRLKPYDLNEVVDVNKGFVCFCVDFQIMST